MRQRNHWRVKTFVHDGIQPYQNLKTRHVRQMKFRYDAVDSLRLAEHKSRFCILGFKDCVICRTHLQPLAPVLSVLSVGIDEQDSRRL